MLKGHYTHQLFKLYNDLLSQKIQPPIHMSMEQQCPCVIKRRGNKLWFSLSPFHNKSYTRGAKPANVSSSTSLSKQYVCAVWQQAPRFYSNELAKTVTSLAESQGQGAFGCHPKH